MPVKDTWIFMFYDDGDEIELLFRIVTVDGVVHDFTLQLSVTLAAEPDRPRIPIRRYDCAHGYAHCDVYNRAGEQIEKIRVDANDYNEAFTIGYDDLNRNALPYLQTYRRS